MRAAPSIAPRCRFERHTSAFWCVPLFAVLAATSLALGFAPPPSSPPAARATAAPPLTDSDDRAVATDTLLARRELAGRVFVLSLPERIGGVPVTRYAAHRAPLMSWVHGRSLVWETRGTPEGTHRFRYLVHRADAATPPDTLTLVVTLE